MNVVATVALAACSTMSRRDYDNLYERTAAGDADHQKAAFAAWHAAHAGASDVDAAPLMLYLPEHGHEVNDAYREGAVVEIAGLRDGERVYADPQTHELGFYDGRGQACGSGPDLVPSTSYRVLRDASSVVIVRLRPVAHVRHVKLASCTRGCGNPHADGGPVGLYPLGAVTASAVRVDDVTYQADELDVQCRKEYAAP